MWRKHPHICGAGCAGTKKKTEVIHLEVANTQFHQTRLVFCAIVLPVTEAHGWPLLHEVWLLMRVVLGGEGLSHKNVRKTGL